MPVDLKMYPKTWKKRIAPACKKRADYKCERCGIEHGVERIGKTYKRPYTMYLAAAHLNHNTKDNRKENLIALCQDCHLLHDIPQHVQNSRATRQRKRYEAQIEAGQLELFKPPRKRKKSA